MGNIVPGISSTVIQNNVVILNIWYAVAYRATLTLWLCDGAANG
ncbi:hypothetical protein [Nitrosomonas sp. JL21]|nr:hypothetical protein [Nitrosomonas sp. JL21]